MPKIIIRRKGGKFTVETKGFAGKKCFEATADLEAGLGVIGETQRTPEYYRPSQKQEQHQSQ